MRYIYLFLSTSLIYFSSFTAQSQVENFIKTDCDGVEYNLFNDLQAGNAVVLNFCAGWCAPCRIADVYLEEFYQDTCQGNSNVSVLGMLFQDTQSNPSDCTFGQLYATQYELTFPIITDCLDELDYFNPAQNATTLPLFLVIIPDTVNPENSQVIDVYGDPNDERDYTQLSASIQNILNANGFGPEISTTLEPTCQDGSFEAILTSNFTENNLWSTGETTQSITVNSAGTYSLSIDGICGLPATITYSNLPIAGTLTAIETEVCANSNITLNYSGGNGQFTYQYFSAEEDMWVDDTSNNASITPVKTTNPVDKFRVRIDNGSPFGDASCITYSNELIINSIDSSPPITISTDLLCSNDSVDLLSSTTSYNITDGHFEYAFPNTDPYNYYLVSPTANPGDTITFSNLSLYFESLIRFRYVGLDSDTGCTVYSETKDVNVNLPISLNWPDCLYTSESLTIDNVDANLPILWSTGESTASISPLTSGTFSVNYTNINTGCESFYSKYIEVIDSQNIGMVTISENYICEPINFDLLWNGSGTAIWQINLDNVWFTFEQINDMTQFTSLPTTAMSNVSYEYPADYILSPQNTNTLYFRVALGCSDNYLYSNEVSLVLDTESPVIVCPTELNANSNGEYTLPDYYLNNTITATDNCYIESVVQTPAPGTSLPQGVHNISFLATDRMYNTYTNMFELTITDNTLNLNSFELSENDILITPNPGTNQVTIINNSHIALKQALLYDINGRLLKTIPFENMQTDKTIPLTNYTNGLYLLKIESDKGSITKRIVKL